MGRPKRTVYLGLDKESLAAVVYHPMQETVSIPLTNSDDPTHRHELLIDYADMLKFYKMIKRTTYNLQNNDRI